MAARFGHRATWGRRWRSSGSASDAERITREATELIGESTFAEAFARGLNAAGTRDG